jgi:hypothetical protein
MNSKRFSEILKLRKQYEDFIVHQQQHRLWCSNRLFRLQDLEL